MGGSQRLRRRLSTFAVVTALLGGLLGVPSATHAVSHGGRLLDEGIAEFESPWGIATDEFGDIYVSDTRKNRITKFDGATKQAEWVSGEYGSGNGQLYVPQGLAVGGGVVYVADTLNHRIAMFTQEGAWAGSLVGEGDQAFAYPADVDYRDGLLYVAEGGARCQIRIIRVSGSSFTTVATAGSCGGQPHQLSSPSGVAVTDTDIFVVDPQLNVVKRFDSFGNYVSTIGEPGTERGQLDGPYALAVTKTEAEGTHIWVIESGLTSRAQRFNADGKVKNVLTGTNKSHFTFPHGIALSPTADTLYVADTSAEDPQVYFYFDHEPKLFVHPDDNLRRLGRTEGIWFSLAYNQTTKSCKVLARARVSIPGRDTFTVEDDFRVHSKADDFKIDVSDRRGKWLRQAKQADRKVSIDATFRGNCQEDATVRATEDYKAK